MTPAGRLVSDAETAYALALQFGLLDDTRQRQLAGARLAAIVRERGYRIGTGFVGTPLICDALCSAGEVETAYRLLLQRRCPSWLYPVTMGATTIWERWDSMRPDGTVNPGEMTSFNHYALGAVVDWLHRRVAGLGQASPAYRILEIHPLPGCGLTSARARLRTPYGIAESGWAWDAGTLTVSIAVPPGTTARVSLPGQDGDPVEVDSGHHNWAYRYDLPTLPESDPSDKLDDVLSGRELPNALKAFFDDLAPAAAPRLTANAVMRSGKGMTLRQVIASLPEGEALLRQMMPS